MASAWLPRFDLEEVQATRQFHNLWLLQGAILTDLVRQKSFAHANAAQKNKQEVECDMNITPTYRLVRRDDPATSHDAAESIDATALESVVADAIWEFGAAGAIADEVCNALPRHAYNTITPRFKPLKDKGIIITDGTRRKAKSGRGQMVMWHKEFYQGATDG